VSVNNRAGGIYINRGVQPMHSLKGSELAILTTGFKYIEGWNKL
jgi:hypothetical protein